ncbi:MAG TPA: hypothetical protein VH298_02535 [Jatrophihabitans sp.]|jgi:hypothetical protein|nr:hypothetical protein [Jatrophihabitans sp.]
MDVLIPAGLVLIIAVTYYLSRRSNRKAAERLRSATPHGRRTSPDQLARFEQLRAEHLGRAQAVQTDNGIGPY